MPKSKPTPPGLLLNKSEFYIQLIKSINMYNIFFNKIVSISTLKTQRNKFTYIIIQRKKASFDL
jgi:hypothetical protein